jgi:hypothetical protein
MMTTRVLPPEEWDRLAGTELEGLAAARLDTMTVLAVEDAEGAIVGCWSLLPIWHVEGIWIAPDHRGRSAVARRLLAGMRAVMAARGLHGVWTGAALDTVASLITRIGGRALPAQYYLPRTPEE